MKLSKKELAALKAASKALHALLDTGLIDRIDALNLKEQGPEHAEPLYIGTALQEIDSILADSKAKP